MRHFWRAGVLLLCAAPALAQTPSDPPYSTAGQNAGAASVPLVYDTGCACFRPIDSTHPLPVSASVSASISAFQPTATVGLSVTGTTANVAFGDANTSAIVDNKGSNDAFITVGANPMATTTALRVPAGSAVAIATGGAAKIAAITASSTTTLLVTTGTGLPALTYASSGGGGGSNASVGTTSSAVPGSATYLGGTNAGNLQGVAVNGSGQVAIQAPPSLPLPSGAATAANQTNVQGTVAPGTAAANSTLAGGQYNSTAPAPTNGQGLALQLDASGNLKVSGGAAAEATTSGQLQSLVSAAVVSGDQSYTAGKTDAPTLGTDGKLRVKGAAPTGSAAPADAEYAAAVSSGNLTGLIACDSYVWKHITSATDTLLVQGVSGKTVYLCGVKVFAAGTNTLYLENTASANANCSSTLTQIDIALALTAQTGLVDRAPFYSGLKTTAANGLCVNSAGSGAVDLAVYYTQF